MDSSRDLHQTLSFLKAVMSDLGAQANAAQSSITSKPKEGRDIVTDIDLKLEAQLIASIRSKLPDDSFEAEERSSESGSSHWSWVIDPIDGTINYAARLSLYSISVALKHDDST